MSGEQHVFAIAPLEMARDHRLTAAHYRVLLALLSFRNREGNLVWPSRERLAELTDYTVNSISKYTRQLERLGWLEKEGNGGRSRAVRYRITVPEIGGEKQGDQREPCPVNNRGTSAKTLSNLETVSNLETLSNPDTKTLSNLDRGIEQTREQTKCCADARARAREGSVKQPVAVEHPAHLVATFAELGFRAEQVHTPKVMAMLSRWQSLGVTQDMIRQLVTNLRARAPNRAFGPAYLDAPMHDYLEALRHDGASTGSTNRAAHRQPPVSRAKRIADKLDEIARDDIARNGYVEML